MTVKPPFTYFGAKSGIASQIVAMLPEHDHYVEPFAGSLSVLLAKPQVRMETVNDLDCELMTFWRMLRDRPDDLARVCTLTPHSRTEFLAGRNACTTADPLETARRVWMVLTQGRGGTLRESKSGWRHFVAPRGSSIGMPAYLDGYVERMASVAERLHAVSLESMPALDLISKYGNDPETLLYVDPPYLGSTRTGWGNAYRHELRGANEHRELADALAAARAAVVISGYPSELYDRELYSQWYRTEIAATTGNAVVRERVEVLWANRLMPVQLELFPAVGAVV